MITKPEPRAYTQAEVTRKFLGHIQRLAVYWADKGVSKADACDGLVFSIMSMLDGCALVIPGFTLTADPADSAYKNYCQSVGENWVESGTKLEPMLHEQWSAMKKAALV